MPLYLRLSTSLCLYHLHSILKYTLLQKKVYTLIPGEYGLKVSRKSLLGHYIMSKSSQKSVCAIDFFVTGWQSACLQTLLQNFRTTLNFFTNLVLFGVELQRAVPHTVSFVLHDLGFEYTLTETQSVYFLLELSVYEAWQIIPVSTMFPSLLISTAESRTVPQYQCKFRGALNFGWMLRWC